MWIWSAKTREKRNRAQRRLNQEEEEEEERGLTCNVLHVDHLRAADVHHVLLVSVKATALQDEHLLHTMFLKKKKKKNRNKN